MLVQDFGDALRVAFSDLSTGVVAFLPKIFISVIIFILGWIVAVAFGRVVAQGIRAMKIDKVLEGIGVSEPLARAGFRLDSGAFIGGLVRWFFIIVFLVAAVDVLGLDQNNAFLVDVVLVYLPNVIVAAIILVVAAVVADVARQLVVGSAKAAHLPSVGLLGGMTKWSIWVFAILAALYQLGVAGPFVQTLFTGFVAAASIAVGLSFGLGGKDAASRFLDKLRSDMESR
ncbi:MAG: hypothetical protein AAB930_01385 [Patescibacteria group bacterium]